MRMHCQTCGCHFDDDFEETLQPECKLWENKGFAPNTTEAHKRIMWDAYFSMPVDAIADETGVILSFDFKATPGMTYTFNQFMEYVPGYKYMTDRERRDLQKAMFKFSYNQDPQERIIVQLRSMGVLRKLRNLEKKRSDD